MSIREHFHELLLKKYSISPDEIESYEIKKGVLYLRTKSKKIVKIKDLETIKAAEARTNETILLEIFEKEKLLKRIYAIKKVYEDFDEHYNEFEKNYELKNEIEILEELKELEEKYIKNKKPEKFGEDIIVRIQLELFKRGHNVISGLSYFNLPYLTQQLAEMLADISEEKRVRLKGYEM